MKTALAVVVVAACGSAPAPAPVNGSGSSTAPVVVQPFQALTTKPAELPATATPWIGVQVSADNHVAQVIPNAPAERAGVQVGDELVSLDGVGLFSPQDLPTRVRSSKVGDKVTLRVRRATGEVDLPIVLEAKKEIADIRVESLIDHAAPDFTPEPIGNVPGPVKLADVAGHVTVLDFWATWCGPCKASIPHLSELHDRYPDLRIVGLSVEDAQDIHDFATTEKMTYPLARDAGGLAWQRYLVDAIPMMVIIDRGGVIRDIAVGVGDFDALDKELVAMMLKK
nr:redoxin domain-containing protein [Kofleriaceae bacterium]